MRTWNDRLREAREASGIPKGQFARRVGVSAPTVTDWESGKIAKIDGANLVRACSVLGVDPNWIITGRPAPDYIDGEVVRPALPGPGGGVPDIGALMAAASPRSRDALEQIAEAAQAGRLTEADVELLAQIAARLSQTTAT